MTKTGTMLAQAKSTPSKHHPQCPRHRNTRLVCPVMQRRAEAGPLYPSPLSASKCWCHFLAGAQTDGEFQRCQQIASKPRPRDLISGKRRQSSALLAIGRRCRKRRKHFRRLQCTWPGHAAPKKRISTLAREQAREGHPWLARHLPATLSPLQSHRLHLRPLSRS